MNKKDFLFDLQKKLSAMPSADVQERLGFYNEIIEDKLEEGLSEEEAIKEIGTADEIAKQILSDYPLSKLVKEQVKKERSLKTWELILLIVGFPVWGSLLISVLAIILAVYISLWAVVISLWAADLALVICGLAMILFCFALIFQGDPASGLASLGMGAAGLGIGILLFFGCLYISKAAIWIPKKVFSGLKSMFIK
jgi:uncharacterized membrane protein